MNFIITVIMITLNFYHNPNINFKFPLISLIYLFNATNTPFHLYINVNYNLGFYH
jgi:hypothetical protein